MFTILLQWIMQPKNAILTAIVVAFLGLFVHDRYLNHEVNSKEQEITVLNGEITNLKTSIDIQNTAIKKMNDDFTKQKSDFDKEYADLQVKNKPKVELIKKQESYVSPVEVKTKSDEYDQSMKLIQQFEQSRGIK